MHQLGRYLDYRRSYLVANVCVDRVFYSKYREKGLQKRSAVFLFRHPFRGQTRGLHFRGKIQRLLDSQGGVMDVDFWGQRAM